MKPFQSPFANRLSDYVELRKRLGFQFQVQTEILSAFDRHAREHGWKHPLTQEMALDFASHNPNVSPGECARRYQVLRHFADYLGTFDPAVRPFPVSILRRPSHRPPAHIYTEDELSRLLATAKGISHAHPIRGITLHAMVGLAAATGLRIREVVRLDKSDVDLDRGILTIRQTKFAKDRLVPLHPTTREVLRDYAAARDIVFADGVCSAFFINLWGRRFAKHTLQMTFWDLTRKAGLRGNEHDGPTFHDLRHTFAVRRLVNWYREGVDPQAMLPALATYMGHAHYTDTAYYLSATSELMALAADRRQHHDEREGARQ